MAQVRERTNSGGSRFAPAPILEAPLRAPVGIATVLFRPFVFEANNIQTMVAAMDGTFLLLLFMARIRWAIAAVGSARRQPYVAFAILYLAMFVIAFSGVGNFGLLARERVQVMPLFFLLFSIPSRKEAEMAAHERNKSDAWTAKRARRAPFGPKWRGDEQDEVHGDVGGVAQQFQVLETRVNELETTLRELGGSADASGRDEPPKSDDPYNGVSGRVVEALRSLYRETERLRRDALEEAERIVATAKAEVQSLRSEALATREEARVAADRLLQEARAQAEHAVSSLAQQRNEIVGDLLTLRGRVTTVLEDLHAELEKTTGDRVAMPEGDEPGEQRSTPDPPPGSPNAETGPERNT